MPRAMPASEVGAEQGQLHACQGGDVEQGQLHACQGGGGRPEQEDAPDALEDASLRPTAQRVSGRELIRSVVGVGAIFFTRRESRCKALALAAGIFVSSCASTGMLLFFLMQQGAANQALVDRQESVFLDVIHRVCVVVVVFAVFSCINDLLKGVVALEWRRSITRHLLSLYIGDSQAYYKLKLRGSLIDNPDQRIAQDVGKFTTIVLDMMLTFMKSGLSIAVFSPTLFRISPKLLGFVLIYSAALNLISFGVFGGPLTRISRLALGQEASLRFGLVRVREYAEPIAFYQGAPFENRYCNGLFSEVLRTLYQQMILQTVFQSMFTSAALFAIVAPYWVVAGDYFDGNITFGDMSVAGGCLHQLISSFSSLVAKLGEVTDMGAQAVRVKHLLDVVQEMQEESEMAVEKEDSSKSSSHCEKAVSGGCGCCTMGPQPGVPKLSPKQSAVSLLQREVGASGADGALVCLRSVTLQATRGKVPLVSDLSLRLWENQSLIVTGPSGVGKSSLLRAIGGLWAAGEGVIERCAASECFFVPQEPYLCKGSLRDNAIYPLRAGEESKLLEPTDEEIVSALRDVQLGYLAERFSLDKTVAFDSVLSGGERQRLGFVRLLLRRNLRFALLDEATSALDVENENRVYSLLKQRVTCYMSVGHRPNLVNFHTHKLSLERMDDGTCTWTMEDAQA